MRQGPPALPLAASAGAALPGLDCCRRTRRSAAFVVAGRVPSGEVCRLSTSGAVLRAQHLVTEGEFSRWSDMVCPFARAMTQGGRAMIQHQRAQRQRSSPHLPLPQHMLEMPGASQRVPRCVHEILSCIVCFDSALAGDFQDILWKLSALRMRCTSCQSRRTHRIARNFVISGRLSFPFMLCRRMHHVAGTRARCANASVRCLLYITLDR